MPKRIFITVAETSGDHHAAKMVRALKHLDPDHVIQGYGGPAMAAAGAEILYETTAKAAMTFHAVKRVFEFRRLLKRAKTFYNDPTTKPDLQICVDSSGVNLHFARAAKEAGIPVLYYVAPQLWASREYRIKQVRKYVDQIASIFPFEADWYNARGAKATFVGHPLFDDLPVNRYERPEPRFPNAPPVVGIVPGSRTSEVKANLPHLMDVMNRIREAFPGVQYLIPTVASTDELVRASTRGMGASPMHSPAHGRGAHATGSVRFGMFDELIPQCDLVLTKSGTSTVHTAAFGVPMIVVYRASPILWHLAGRWLIRTKKIAMVNILAGQVDLVPEFIPWYGSNQPVADCAIDLLKQPDKLKDQRRKLRDLTSTIDAPGASMNVARLALGMIS